jgi:hypothetical protein
VALPDPIPKLTVEAPPPQPVRADAPPGSLPRTDVGAVAAATDEGDVSGLSAQTYVLGAATLVATLVSIGFGVAAHFERADLIANCARPCAATRISPVHTNQIVADVSLGAAAVSLGLTIWSAW